MITNKLDGFESWNLTAEEAKLIRYLFSLDLFGDLCENEELMYALSCIQKDLGHSKHLSQTELQKILDDHNFNIPD